ncbi:MAG: Branched-chain amino acid transporter, amino acid-binding protein, partial [Chloroflexi bacterium]|nr:Branched-chain amino acid transporter, amino acid-binding protein [Chloroflexota bacterium]
MGPYAELSRLLVGPSIAVLLAGCATTATSSPATTPVATVAPSPTGSMATARGAHTATLLPDGRVLVAGGASTAGEEGLGGLLAGAETYDPASGTFVGTGPLATARAGATATLLSDGRVLVAAGFDVPRPGAVSTLRAAEIYDPASGTFGPTGSLVTARYLHTATLLPDGRVLITGGFDPEAGYLASAEIYDPANGTFVGTGPLTAGRYGHTATLLPDGRVLVAGGFDRGAGYLASAEIFDPVSGTFV